MNQVLNGFAIGIMSAVIEVLRGFQSLYVDEVEKVTPSDDEVNSISSNE